MHGPGDSMTSRSHTTRFEYGAIRIEYRKRDSRLCSGTLTPLLGLEHKHLCPCNLYPKMLIHYPPGAAGYKSPLVNGKFQSLAL